MSGENITYISCNVYGCFYPFRPWKCVICMKYRFKKCQTRKPGFEHDPNLGFQVWKTAGFPGYQCFGKPGFITLIAVNTWSILTVIINLFKHYYVNAGHCLHNTVARRGRPNSQKLVNWGINRVWCNWVLMLLLLLNAASVCHTPGSMNKMVFVVQKRCFWVHDGPCQSFSYWSAVVHTKNPFSLCHLLHNSINTVPRDMTKKILKEVIIVLQQI